jgi:hypothetical protein
MTKMLNELNHPALQSRRRKQRMIFFYIVVEGQVPAMPPDLFVKYQKSKRQIRAKQIDNCIANNIVTSSVRNNSKCIVIPPSRADQYKHFYRCCLYVPIIWGLLLFVVLGSDLMVLVPGFGCLICRSGDSSFWYLEHNSFYIEMHSPVWCPFL